MGGVVTRYTSPRWVVYDCLTHITIFLGKVITQLIVKYQKSSKLSIPTHGCLQGELPSSGIADLGVAIDKRIIQSNPNENTSLSHQFPT